MEEYNPRDLVEKEIARCSVCGAPIIGMYYIGGPIWINGQPSDFPVDEMWSCNHEYQQT